MIIGVWHVPAGCRVGGVEFKAEGPTEPQDHAAIASLRICLDLQSAQNDGPRSQNREYRQYVQPQNNGPYAYRAMVLATLKVHVVGSHRTT